MASTLNASTSGVGGIITTADNTGNLDIQSGGSTKIAVTSGGVALSTPLGAASGGTGLSSVGTSGNVLTSNGTAWVSSAAGGLGVGQTWQIVTGSRSLATTYYNTTGKPIYVSVSTYGNAGGYADAKINGSAVLQAGSQSGGSGYSTSPLTLIVPDGSSYIIGNNGVTLWFWAELR